MKPKSFFLIILFFCSITSGYLSAQEITFQPFSNKKILKAAYKGDTIILNIKRKKGSKLQKVILTHDNKTIFTAHELKKLQHFLIAPHDGIYQLELVHEHKKELTLDLDFTIKPSTAKIASIGYQLMRDTTYGYTTQQYRKVTLQKASNRLNEKYFLNSRSNAILKGGKNRVIIPISLPKDTKTWHFSFTASRSEEQIANTLKSFNLASELTGFLNTENKLKDAVSQLNVPPGANICDIYLFDEENAKAFKERKTFQYIAEGSRENIKSGIVNLQENTAQKYFIGINNPDNVYGIHIAISVAAMMTYESEILEKINIPIITSYEIPVLK